jgi:hypothetical protein
MKAASEAMALNDDQARLLPGHAGDPSPERPAGLLEKLVAAIRPEFRAGVLVTGPGDPVFGGSPCAVEGCGRAARLHGLCDGHYQRWHNQGRGPRGVRGRDVGEDARQRADDAMPGTGLRLRQEQHRPVRGPHPDLAEFRAP